MGQRLQAIVNSVRPSHWVKNGFVLAPLAFTPTEWNLHSLTLAVAAFGVFCFASGAAYLFNDLRDVAADRIHPEKSKRPIASGELSLGLAGAAAAGLSAIALGIFMNGSLILLIHLLVETTPGDASAVQANWV